MRKLLFFSILMVIMLVGCKPGEENYRKAYQRAVAADSTRTDFSETVYARYRNQVRHQPLLVGNDSIDTAIDRVAIDDADGSTNEKIRRYCVVADGFKQAFNARSMRQRLADNGWPGAIVVKTGEPFYYVVALSTNNKEEAAAALTKLKTTPPFPLRSQPYLLQPAQLLR